MPSTSAAEYQIRNRARNSFTPRRERRLPGHCHRPQSMATTGQHRRHAMACQNEPRAAAASAICRSPRAPNFAQDVLWPSADNGTETSMWQPTRFNQEACSSPVLGTRRSVRKPAAAADDRAPALVRRASARPWLSPIIVAHLRLPVAGRLLHGLHRLVGLAQRLPARDLSRPPPAQRPVRRRAAHYDMLQLAVLLYLTGGIENPFIVLLVAPVTVSAATLPTR